MALTADTITDEQIRELARSGDLHTRALAAAATRVYYTTKQRAARDEARARCAEILNARANVNVMDGGDGWPPDDRTPAQVEADRAKEAK